MADPLDTNTLPTIASSRNLAVPVTLKGVQPGGTLQERLNAEAMAGLKNERSAFNTPGYTGYGYTDQAPGLQFASRTDEGDVGTYAQGSADWLAKQQADEAARKASAPVTAGLPTIAPNERESRLSVVPGMSQEEIARANALPAPKAMQWVTGLGGLREQQEVNPNMQVTRYNSRGLPMTPRELATEATQQLAQTGMNIKQQEANTAENNVYGENAFRAMQGRTMGSAHLGEINKQKMHDEYLDPNTPEDRRERIGHILGVIKPEDVIPEKDATGLFTGRVLNKSTGEMKGGPTPPTPKEGSRHQDANGNIATWTGGKWVPEKK